MRRLWQLSVFIISYFSSSFSHNYPIMNLKVILFSPIITMCLTHLSLHNFRIQLNWVATRLVCYYCFAFIPWYSYTLADRDYYLIPENPGFHFVQSTTVQLIFTFQFVIVKYIDINKNFLKKNFFNYFIKLFASCYSKRWFKKKIQNQFIYQNQFIWNKKIGSQTRNSKRLENFRASSKRMLIKI